MIKCLPVKNTCYAQVLDSGGNKAKESCAWLGLVFEKQVPYWPVGFYCKKYQREIGKYPDVIVGHDDPIRLSECDGPEITGGLSSGKPITEKRSEGRIDGFGSGAY